MLDSNKLELLRDGGDGKRIAQCPACAETGGDRRGEHLAIFDDGRYACVMYQGDPGKAHRKRICDLAGAGGRRKPRREPLVPIPVEIRSSAARDGVWC